MCGTLCWLDGESHLLHKDGAVSKPVQFSEAAGSVQKRIISLLGVNSLESPKVSQCICYSYLCEILVSMSIWNRRFKECSTCRSSPRVVSVCRQRRGQSSYHSF